MPATKSKNMTKFTPCDEKFVKSWGDIEGEWKSGTFTNEQKLVEHVAKSHPDEDYWCYPDRAGKPMYFKAEDGTVTFDKYLDPAGAPKKKPTPKKEVEAKPVAKETTKKEKPTPKKEVKLKAETPKTPAAFPAKKLKKSVATPEKEVKQEDAKTKKAKQAAKETKKSGKEEKSKEAPRKQLVAKKGQNKVFTADEPVVQTKDKKTTKPAAKETKKADKAPKTGSKRKAEEETVKVRKFEPLTRKKAQKYVEMYKGLAPGTKSKIPVTFAYSKDGVDFNPEEYKMSIQQVLIKNEENDEKRHIGMNFRLEDRCLKKLEQLGLEKKVKLSYSNPTECMKLIAMACEVDDAAITKHIKNGSCCYKHHLHVAGWLLGTVTTKTGAIQTLDVMCSQEYRNPNIKHTPKKESKKIKKEKKKQVEIKDESEEEEEAEEEAAEAEEEEAEEEEAEEEEAEEEEAEEEEAEEAEEEEAEEEEAEEEEAEEEEAEEEEAEEEEVDLQVDDDEVSYKEDVTFVEEGEEEDVNEEGEVEEGVDNEVEGEEEDVNEEGEVEEGEEGYVHQGGEFEEDMEVEGEEEEDVNEEGEFEENEDSEKEGVSVELAVESEDEMNADDDDEELQVGSEEE